MAIIPPSEDASDEDKAQFRKSILEKVDGIIPKPSTDNLDEVFQALGKPQEAEQYAIENVEGLEGVYVEDNSDFLKQAAHDANLTKDQYDTFLTKVFSHLKDQMAQQPTQEDVVHELQKDWGVSTEAKTAQVASFIKEVWPEKDVSNLDAETYRGFATILDKLGVEPSAAANGAHRGGEPVITPSLAKRRLDEIDNNPQHPYHRGDENARKEYVNLVGIATSAG